MPLSPSPIFRHGPSYQDRTPLTTALTKGLLSSYPMRKKRFHAKDLSFCPRRAVMLMHINEETLVQVSASSEFYMTIGTAVHTTICKAFKAAGILRYEEFRIQECGLNVGGYADAIVELDRTYRVVEFKTCGKLPDLPKPEHVAQVRFYSLATGLREPMLLYQSRNVAAFGGELIIKEFEVPTSDEMLYNIALESSIGFYSLEEKMAPPIPPAINVKSKCGFCPFVSICFGGEQNFMEELESSPAATKRVLTKAKKHADFLMETMDKRCSETEAAIEEERNKSAKESE